MYIKKAVINNIRSISHFEMEFSQPAGWHVLIGDNGAGKSSVVRSFAAALIGPDQIAAVLPVWEEWLTVNESSGLIELQLERDKTWDKTSQTRPPNKLIKNTFEFEKNGRVELKSNADEKSMNPKNYNWGNNAGWFSVAYGPFRRFTGGDNKWSKVYYSAPKAGAHLSVFGEDIALTEALDWLKELDRKRLKQKESEEYSQVSEPGASYQNETETIFENIKKFINQSGLLPHNAYFDRIDIDGELIYKDGNGNPVRVTQMSDGFRSVLSLTFELIRQLAKIYTAEKVFAEIQKGGVEHMKIMLPGVVLIDEIDVHLHPSWQTRVGQWFTKHFPNLQFIVTTHSPLVCRACENGSIWRLAAPGSGEQSGEVIGLDKEKLITGNILDAYGTEVFGKSPVRSEKSNEKLKRLGRLNMLSALGKINTQEEKERLELQQILTTDAPIG
jgi:predicted ATP-binding protein involved in virulence